MAAHCRQRVLEEFSPESNVRGYEKLYESLTNSSVPWRSESDDSTTRPRGRRE
jgi:hypothetical protein